VPSLRRYNSASSSSSGTWRSPVAHCNGVAGVAGSNPAVPTRWGRPLVAHHFGVNLNRLIIVLMAAGLIACSRSADRDSAPGKGGFSASLGVDTAAMTKTPSGLRYQDVTPGQGKEATPGRAVSVHYTGWLPNGEKFDSSRDRNQPFGFTLGAGEVIAGWDEGVAGMKVGGRRKLVIPPDLAYGTAGAPPDIPPGATLVFDVELLDVR
jgi:hypothetical protein